MALSAVLNAHIKQSHLIYHTMIIDNACINKPTLFVHCHRAYIGIRHCNYLH